MTNPKPQIIDSFAPINIDDIGAFEQRTGIQLHPDYKRFLTTTNGGSFSTATAFGDLEIFLFYAINADMRYADLERQADLFNASYYKMLPIGRDAFGNSICYRLNSDDPTIFFCDHDEDNRAKVIAPNLQHILDRLRYSDDLDEDDLDDFWLETREPFISVEKGDLNALLQQEIDLEDRNDQKRTLLACAAVDRQPAVAEYLISRGATLEARDKRQATPLNLAATYGAMDVIKLLCEAGANLESRDQKGMTPLLNAASSKHDRAVKILLNYGADPQATNNKGDSLESLYATCEYALRDILTTK